MAALLAGMSALSLCARPCGLSSRAAVRGEPVVLRATGSVAMRARGAVGLQVEAKQNAKKRVRQSEKARMHNKSKKSEVATRIKKVLVAVAAAKAGGSSVEALNTLLSEAYKVIDKAAGKGILKKNTAARRKSLIAVARDSVTAAPAAAPTAA